MHLLVRSREVSRTSAHVVEPPTVPVAGPWGLDGTPTAPADGVPVAPASVKVLVTLTHIRDHGDAAPAATPVMETVEPQPE